MNETTTLMCGVIIVTIPTIQFGGYFLLSTLTGKFKGEPLTPFQTSMFRAGHAHAGVLVILSLIAQILAEYTGLGEGLTWFARISIPASAIFIAGGFFGAAAGKQVTEPTKLIWLLHIGAVLLMLGLITLGVGLIVR